VGGLSAAVCKCRDWKDRRKRVYEGFLISYLM
jgi:hypothetical protein